RLLNCHAVLEQVVPGLLLVYLAFAPGAREGDDNDDHGEEGVAVPTKPRLVGRLGINPPLVQPNAASLASSHALRLSGWRSVRKCQLFLSGGELEDTGL